MATIKNTITIDALRGSIPTYSLTFTVSVAGGAALENASILCNSETKLTNASGQAVFTLAADTYAYSVTLAGYTTINDNVTVTGDQGESVAMFDTDATAFITASGISDATQLNALNKLVFDLKAQSLWTKMKAVYPVIGGSASTHKWNLIDPRDLDAAFRLTFGGGWTHAATGMTPNGTTGWVDTFFNPSTDSVDWITNNTQSFYSRTQAMVGGGWNMGVGNIATGIPLFGIGLRAVNNALFDSGGFPGARTSSVQADGRGLWAGSCRAANEREFYRNGASLTTNVNNDVNAASNANIALGALFDTNTGLPANFMTHEMAFAVIAEGLTDTEHSNLYTLVQVYQTTLSRQV